MNYQLKLTLTDLSKRNKMSRLHVGLLKAMCLLESSYNDLFFKKKEKGTDWKFGQAFLLI